MTTSARNQTGEQSGHCGQAFGGSSQCCLWPGNIGQAGQAARYISFFIVLNLIGSTIFQIFCCAATTDMFVCLFICLIVHL